MTSSTKALFFWKDFVYLGVESMGYDEQKIKLMGLLWKNGDNTQDEMKCILDPYWEELEKETKKIMLKVTKSPRNINGIDFLRFAGFSQIQMTLARCTEIDDFVLTSLNQAIRLFEKSPVPVPLLELKIRNFYGQILVDLQYNKESKSNIKKAKELYDSLSQLSENEKENFSKFIQFSPEKWDKMKKREYIYLLDLYAQYYLEQGNVVKAAQHLQLLLKYIIEYDFLGSMWTKFIIRATDASTQILKMSVHDKINSKMHFAQSSYILHAAEFVLCQHSTGTTKYSTEEVLSLHGLLKLLKIQHLVNLMLTSCYILQHKNHDSYNQPIAVTEFGKMKFPCDDMIFWKCAESKIELLKLFRFTQKHLIEADKMIKTDPMVGLCKKSLDIVAQHIRGIED